MPLKLTPSFNEAIELIQDRWHEIYTRRRLTKAEIASKCIKRGLEAWSERPGIHLVQIEENAMTEPEVKLPAFSDAETGLIRAITRKYWISQRSAYNQVGEIGAREWMSEIKQIKALHDA